MESSCIPLLRAFALLCLFFSPAASQNGEPLAIRIACGSDKNVHVEGSKKLWVKDFGYSGGISANGTITSYAAPALKKLREFRLSDGPNNCYSITDLPLARYSVRAFFGLDVDVLAEREPLFDISVEGTQVLSLKPGWSTNDAQSYVEVSTPVSDGTATFCLHSTGHGDPTVMSLEILQVSRDSYNTGKKGRLILRTVIRLNCGASDGKFGDYYSANPWGGDRFWDTDWAADKTLTSALSTTSSIRYSSVSPNFYPEAIYQSASKCNRETNDLTYNFKVDPVKRYSVWLHFAEIESGIQRPGQRVFDVVINGQVAFSDVDVVKMAGGPFAAVVLNSTVVVGARTLSITFRPQKHTAFVSAIEVFEIIEMENSTFPEQASALQAIKRSLGLPLRFGWNGDPCVPQQHPWSGIDCQFDKQRNKWFIDGLVLDNQGLSGYLSDDVSNLHQLHGINLSSNSIHGYITPKLGMLSLLEYLDLSYNMLNGSIPESLGNLTHLKKLYLNGNLLTGQVPAALGSGPIHGESFNFSGNHGLCGIPGLRSCGSSLSSGSKAGIALGVIIVGVGIAVCGCCMWKRRQNVLRAKNAARQAPYAKARTNFTKDVQMSKPHYNEHSQPYNEAGPQLLQSTHPLAV